VITILVGPPGSGKSTVRRLLEGKGWVGYEASDFVKAAMREHQAADLAELRASAGSLVAAQSIWRTIQERDDTAPTVISGFRGTSEIDHFRSKGPTAVVGLYAPLSTCCARIAGRQRPGDDSDIVRIRSRIQEEYSSGLAAIFFRQVDVFVSAERDPGEIARLIHDLKHPIVRPGWILAPDALHAHWSTGRGEFPTVWEDRIAVAPVARI